MQAASRVGSQVGSRPAAEAKKAERNCTKWTTGRDSFRSNKVASGGGGGGRCYSQTTTTSGSARRPAHIISLALSTSSGKRGSLGRLVGRFVGPKVQPTPNNEEQWSKVYLKVIFAVSLSVLFNVKLTHLPALPELVKRQPRRLIVLGRL